MSAEILRRAANLMRERAEDATPGPWKADEGASGGWWIEAHTATIAELDIDYSVPQSDAEHIASWHPAVALAVAKAMEDVAQAWDISNGWVMDLDDDSIRFEDTVDGGWLNVARAYLGETA